MTNGEYIARIVEQDEDFCILTDDTNGTVTIEVSLDWWNKPKSDVLDKIRAEIEQLRNFRAETYDLEQYCDCFDARIIFRDEVFEIIDKYKTESEEI